MAQVPDVPRILDRMEKAGWVERVRAETDKRMVMATLSESGQKLVAELDEPMPAMMEELFQALNEDEQAKLNDLLVGARKVCPQQ